MDEVTVKPSPTVCIVIAAYNSAETIAKAIQTAQAQSPVSEIFVVDDASSDRTSEIVRGLQRDDARIKLLRFDLNRGPSAARNCAIVQSRAEWIGILDADDYFVGERIAQLLAYSDGQDFIADDLWQVGMGEATALKKTLLNNSVQAAHPISFEEFVLGNISSKKERGELGFIKPLIRRSFLEKHKVSYQEDMRLGEDYELYARSLALGAHMVLLPPQGYVSVVRPNSLSGRHTEEDLAHLRDCNVRIGQLPGLSPRQRAALKKHYRSIDCRLQWRLVILAVKARNGLAFLGAYTKSLPVLSYITAQLFDQLIQRSLDKVGWTKTR